MPTQNIGFDIDFNPENGSFVNVEQIDGQLKLKSIGRTYDGAKQVFAPYGAWISNPIDLVDKYTSLGNLAMNSIVATGTSYMTYTRTSEDGATWDAWVPINIESGEMKSVPRRFIRIKLELFGSADVVKEIVENFDTDEAFDGDNPYVQFSGSKLALKRYYSYMMDKSDSWNGEGAVFRKTIDKSNFKKLDSVMLGLE